MTVFYQLLEPKILFSLMGAKKYHVQTVMLMKWLIHELHIELDGKLDGVIIEIIRSNVHGTSFMYPAIGIRYMDNYLMSNMDQYHVMALIDFTIEKILKERNILSFVSFLASSQIDWEKLTERILTKGF